jgi:hypothetical protein
MNAERKRHEQAKRENLSAIDRARGVDQHRYPRRRLSDRPEADEGESPTPDQSGCKIGRPREHSDEKLRLASAAFDKFRLDSADDKEAWSKVADFYDFPTWNAAKQACHRYTQQQNKTQN